MTSWGRWGALRARDVDDHAAVAHRLPRQAVAAGTHGDPEVVGAREVDGTD